MRNECDLGESPAERHLAGARIYDALSWILCARLPCLGGPRCSGLGHRAQGRLGPRCAEQRAGARKRGG